MNLDEWSTVLIENNVFGNFNRIGIDRIEKGGKCTFYNNSITNASANSLDFKSPRCGVKRVTFDEPCSCNTTYFQQLSVIDITAESFCKIDKPLIGCFNVSIHNVMIYIEHVCNNSTLLECITNRFSDDSSEDIISPNKLPEQSDYFLLSSYLAGGIFVIVLVVGLVLVIVPRYLRKANRSNNVREQKECNKDSKTSTYNRPYFSYSNVTPSAPGSIEETNSYTAFEGYSENSANPEHIYEEPMNFDRLVYRAPFDQDNHYNHMYTEPARYGAIGMNVFFLYYY